MSKPDGMTATKVLTTVPWGTVRKVVVVFENDHGSVCMLMSDKATEGMFLDMCELHVANASVSRALKDEG